MLAWCRPSAPAKSVPRLLIRANFLKVCYISASRKSRRRPPRRCLPPFPSSFSWAPCSSSPASPIGCSTPSRCGSDVCQGNGSWHHPDVRDLCRDERGCRRHRDCGRVAREPAHAALRLSQRPDLGGHLCRRGARNDYSAVGACRRHRAHRAGRRRQDTPWNVHSWLHAGGGLLIHIVIRCGCARRTARAYSSWTRPLSACSSSLSAC
jgi:hypothetical protein